MICVNRLLTPTRDSHTVIWTQNLLRAQRKYKNDIIECYGAEESQSRKQYITCHDDGCATRIKAWPASSSDHLKQRTSVDINVATITLILSSVCRGWRRQECR